MAQYFLAENKIPCFLVELSKQNLLQLNMSKNRKGNLTNVRLWYAVPWGICHTSGIQKKTNSKS